MKYTIGKAISLLICLAVLFALVGCGEAATSGVVKDYEDVRQVTLSVLTNASLTDQLWDDGFIADDGTQINIVEYSSEYYEKENLSYRELVLKRLTSNVDVDCYIIHAEDVIEFSRKNYWMDLSALDAVNSLSPDARRQSTYDGKVFSIPLSYTGFGLYWNVDMLAAHGLDVPTDLDAFLHVCETLKAAGITPYLANKGYALTVPAMATGFSGLYAAENSEELLSGLASGTTPVSTYMADGFALIELMVQKGYFDPVKALDTAPGSADRAGFFAGECAFFCGALQPLDGADFTIALTGVPTRENGTVAVVGANHRMAINPGSPNVRYAIELINNLATPERLAAIAAHEQALSSGKGEYDLSHLPEEMRDFARLVQQGNQIPNQDFSLSFNTWEAIRDLCREICAGATAGEAAEAYDRIQQEQIAAAQQ